MLKQIERKYWMKAAKERQCERKRNAEKERKKKTTHDLGDAFWYTSNNTYYSLWRSLCECIKRVRISSKEQEHNTTRWTGARERDRMEKETKPIFGLTHRSIFIRICDTIRYKAKKSNTRHSSHELHSQRQQQHTNSFIMASFFENKMPLIRMCVVFFYGC